MEDAKFAQLDPMARAKLAVGYLIRHREEVKDLGLDKFFDKLNKYEKSMSEIMNASEAAKKSLSELQARSEQMYGSITSVVEIIAEEIVSETEKVNEWCSKFEPPSKFKEPAMAGSKNMKKAEEIDMAGSTVQSNPESNLATPVHNH